MAAINITGEDFNKTVRGEGITLVDFWCGPCMRFKPVFEKAAEANPDITFAKVDTEAEQGLASALGISSIPTLMVFRDDVLVYREAGALPASALNPLSRSAAWTWPRSRPRSPPRRPRGQSRASRSARALGKSFQTTSQLLTTPQTLDL